MRKKYIIFTITLTLALLFLGSCNNGNQQTPNAGLPTEKTGTEIKGDSMLYGLSCDGTSDSVVIIWPFGGEPRTFSCINAKQSGRIIGKPTIGDWIGIMINPEDTTEATMIIDLDQLKGTWTYPVLPVMKDLQHMSPRMQRRMMSNMPDSVKETFFVPREYGFTLKRGHVAQPVGRIMRSNSLEDDSPVTYPEVQNYKEWHMLNGQLILVSGVNKLIETKEKNNVPDVLDTLQFVYMDEDSLILTHRGLRYGFHRKTNAMEANAAASKAQEIRDSKK